MMSFAEAQEWHSGEIQMHELLHIPRDIDNPTVPGLSSQLAYAIQEFPLLAIGTLDNDGQPWTSVWGGEAGIGGAVAGGMLGITARADGQYDPVVKVLSGNSKEKSVRVEQNETLQRPISGLAIDLSRRKRVKLAGKIVISARDSSVLRSEDSAEDQGDQGLNKTEGDSSVSMEVVIKILESLGNCPKYLNKKVVHHVPPTPQLISKSTHLGPEAQDLIHKADLFFASSTNNGISMDTNHRGGPPGFVRVIPDKGNDERATELVYPEYSGNRLYQTLGNLLITPKMGLVFPDFTTGDVLYITGTALVLTGHEAADLLPRSNLVVKIKVHESIYVRQGLPFRGEDVPNGVSPYNPLVRKTVGEEGFASTTVDFKNVELIRKEDITPTISRYTFCLPASEPRTASWTPGQYVALDFSEELDQGYSHMREGDPRSLNDDFIRTWTISNSPISDVEDSSRKDSDDLVFEITVRDVGTVSHWLKQQKIGTGLKIGFRGFAGDFAIKNMQRHASKVVEEDTSGDQIIPFIAGGIGITPILAHLTTLELSTLRILWVLRKDDVDLALDMVEHEPSIARSMHIWLTGSSKTAEMEETTMAKTKNLSEKGVQIQCRRPVAEDFTTMKDKVHDGKWYLCAGKAFRDQVLAWLPDQEVIYENFDY